MSETYSIVIAPGSTRIAILALDLFGRDRTDVGTWASPVEIRNLTKDEIDFASEFFSLHEVTTTISIQRSGAHD